jgi:HK97 family phage major capsid protein
MPQFNPATIKAETDNTITVAGWLVKFGGADLYDERFTAETNFWLDSIGNSPVILYDHGMNGAVSKSVLGKGTVTQMEDGLWVEAELAKHDKYVQQIAVLIGHGVMGWSSGSVGHLVDRDESENPVLIKSWPIVEASLTVTPAEPRTLGVTQTRTVTEPTIAPQEPEPQAAENAAAPVERALAPALPVVTVLSNPQPAQQENTVENAEVISRLDGVDAKFDAITEILKRFESEPALKNGGFITPDGGNADKNVRSFADYLTAIKRGDSKRLHEHYKVALAEDSGTNGGYLVPPEFSSAIRDVASEQSVVRSRAFVYPMAAREVTIPVLNQTTAPTAGNTSFFGGVSAAWVDEAGALTETEPTFRNMKLVAHKLGGYTLASNELLADSAVGLEALLKKLFGGAVAWYEDYAFLRGNGVGKPLGVQNAPALISVSRTGSGADFEAADVGNMLRRIPPSSMRNAVWVIHPYVIPSLIAMAGTSGSVVTWIGDMRNGMPATLLGLPIVFSEKMVVSGTAFDVLLADFSYYVVGNRDELSIAYSEHFKFTNDQGTWRFTHRVDGQPWLNDKITLSDASSTISPFVALS